MDEWSTQMNYVKYFHQCAPSRCTYTTTDKINLSYAVTLFISLYGGLIIIFRLISSFLVNILFKCHLRNTNVNSGNFFEYNENSIFLDVRLYMISSARFDICTTILSISETIKLIQGGQ